MYMIILLNCFICVAANYGTVYYEGHHQIIKLKEKKSSQDNVIYYDKFLVTPEMPLEIILDKNYYSVECDSHPFESGLDIFYEIKQKDGHSSILVKAVTAYIHSIWFCKLLKSAVLTYITFELVVKDVKPPQLILVNRMVLPTQRWGTEGNYYHKAEYYYDRGEKVDVACINPGDVPFTVELKYGLIETKNAELIPESTKSNFAIGFRTTLEDIHNNTVMRCNSISDDNSHIVLVVKFVQRTYKDTIHLYMNQLRVKGEHLQEDRNGEDIHFNYAYFLNEFDLTIDNYLYVEGVSLDRPTCFYCNGFSPTGSNTRHVANNFTLSKMAKITYYARNETDGSTKQKAVVGFTAISLSLQESYGLKVNLAPENIKMEFYKYENKSNYQRKYTDYIYEYECDEYKYITLNCSKVSPKHGTFLYANTSEPINESSHMQYVNLIAKLHNTIFECSLGMVPETILSRIRILFLMKAPVATTPWIWHSTDTTTEIAIATTQLPEIVKSEFPWIIVVVAILTIIVLVCVCIFVYRKVKKYQFTQRETDGLYQNLQRDFEDPIPPYPTQWENNGSENIEEDSSLYNTTDAIYTQPIPKCDRVRNPEVIYANKETNKLNNTTDAEDLYAKIDTPNRIYVNQATSSAVGKDMYTEVLPKSVRKQNTNAEVSQQYLVDTESDYVQPTYCEHSQLYK